MNNYIEGLLERIGLIKTPRYGLAMGGGGARGFSHIGVLMAMEQYGIKPGIVSGVSAGAIAASLYAAGLGPDDIIDCFASSRKFADFSEWSIPKVGFLKLNKFTKLLDSWLPVKNLEECRVPIVICATNIEKGTSVGWSKGEIVPRIIASCSIPIIFNPVKINGYHYVDGGVLRNLPAWAIRNYCTTLIGSNCSPLNRTYSYKQSLFDVALRTYQLMAKSNVLQDINLCDYVICPQHISASKTFELSALKKNITYGYDAACEVLERIVMGK